MRVAAALFLLIPTAACVTAGNNAVALLPHNAVPVEVWAGGDDGLTQRLADALRSGFERSAQFKLSASGTPDALKVTIPSHVGWDEIKGKTRVSYQLRIDRGARHLGNGRGTCWETELAACAAQMIETASRASHR